MRSKGGGIGGMPCRTGVKGNQRSLSQRCGDSARPAKKAAATANLSCSQVLRSTASAVMGVCALAATDGTIIVSSRQQLGSRWNGAERLVLARTQNGHA